MLMDNEELVTLLNVSNDLRSLRLDKPISDLFVSIPEDAMNCLVATAFNYNCSVEPIHPEGKAIPKIIFDTVEDGVAFAKVIADNGGETWVLDDEGLEYYLPDWINTIALRFDEGDYPKYSSWAYDEQGNYVYNEESGECIGE
jgi:hypothetical protein